MRNGITHWKSLLPLAFALLGAGCGGGGGGGGSTLGSAIPATCSVSGGGGTGTGSFAPSAPTYFKVSDAAQPSDRFGGTFEGSQDGDDTISMSDDGATLVVGAPGDSGGFAQGAVHTYVNSGGWAATSIRAASNPDDSDEFGASVAISGDGNTLAVGAPKEDGSRTGPGATKNDNAADAGAAYVYMRSGIDWTGEVYIKASNTDAGDQFGYSVALSDDGDTLAVGARNEDGGGNKAGAVYIFVRDGGGTWTQQAYLKSSSVEALDEFGYSVALSADGDTLAVGAGEDGNTLDTPSNSGAVHVFIRCDTDWFAQAELKPASLSSNDALGSSIAISDDGDTVASGAPRADGFAGAVYVFRRSTSGEWSVQQRLTADNADSVGDGDLFGSSVSLTDDGNRLAVGAPQEDGDGTGVNNGDTDNSAGEFFEAGAGYVFERTNSSWSQDDYLKASNTETDDLFGTSISFAGNGSALVVGAGGEDGGDEGVNADDSNNDSNNSAGAAYVY